MPLRQLQLVRDYKFSWQSYRARMLKWGEVQVQMEKGGRILISCTHVLGRFFKQLTRIGKGLVVA